MTAHNKGKTQSRINRRYYDKPSASGAIGMILCIGVTSLVAIYGHVVNGVYAKDLGPVEPITIVRITPKPTLMPTATPTPVIKTEGKEDIIAYIKQVFGNEADNAFKILSCENKGLNPKAINHNRDLSTDHGIFQINSIHLKGKAKGKDLNNYKDNIDVAKKIYDDRGWSAWACSHMMGVESFWQ